MLYVAATRATKVLLMNNRLAGMMRQAAPNPDRVLRVQVRGLLFVCACVVCVPSPEEVMLPHHGSIKHTVILQPHSSCAEERPKDVRLGAAGSPTRADGLPRLPL